jgi:hypothetical protein
MYAITGITGAVGGAALGGRVGRRELEAAARVTPNALAAAFAAALGRPVRAEAAPRDQWERLFRDQGMRHPEPRMQMIDGFNAGWIDFPDHGAGARKGAVTLEAAIARLVSSQSTMVSGGRPES